ncbi:autoimmune regulator [Gasterosteus aculeatus]
MNELRSQGPAGELLAVREVCGVCCVEGGELTHCLQCLQRFHVHCHFSKGRSICSSCSRPWSASAEKEAETSRSLQLIHEQQSSSPEGVLHKDELDSILGDQCSIDILQWAFHNISRPHPDLQGCFK